MSWPTVVALGWWTVTRTVRRHPQPVTREHYWIASGVVLLLLPVALFGSQLEDFLVVAVAIAFLTGLPVANRHDETTESGGYALAWYLLAGAVVSSLAVVTVLSEYRTLGVLFGFTLFVCGVAIGLSRRYGI